MDNKTFNKIWDHLQNYEAQYVDFDDLKVLITMAMPDRLRKDPKDNDLKFVYGKYMTHCINNNLI